MPKAEEDGKSDKKDKGKGKGKDEGESESKSKSERTQICESNIETDLLPEAARPRDQQKRIGKRMRIGFFSDGFHVELCK